MNTANPCCDSQLETLEEAMPWVELAIDKVSKALERLSAVVDDNDGENLWDAHERFCLAARTAESGLRITSGCRGGYYRPESFLRFAQMLSSGISLIDQHHATSPDGQHTSVEIISSTEGRLRWVKSVMQEAGL
jgi:hypothetical protein